MASKEALDIARHHVDESDEPNTVKCLATDIDNLRLADLKELRKKVVTAFDRMECNKAIASIASSEPVKIDDPEIGNGMKIEIHIDAPNDDIPAHLQTLSTMMDRYLNEDKPMSLGGEFNFPPLLKGKHNNLHDAKGNVIGTVKID